jgi:hypothetical protein
MRLHNTLFVIASQARAFWKLRAWLGRAGFRGHRQIFGLRGRFRDNTTRAATLWALVRLTLAQIVLAIFVAVLLQALDPYLDGVNKLYPISIDEDAYSTLLATFGGMGAVLIGLYYAATTSIGGAIYARVPNNIRDLLARERVGNVYMQLLAFLTYLDVVLLAFRAAGLAPIKLAILVFLTASGVSIIAFMRLGARAFDLFDPTSLSYDLFEQLRRNYLQMMPGSYRWLDPSFQMHAHRNASSTLDTFSTLAEITAREPHLNGQPFLTLCKHLVGFLINYESAKKSLPTESLWFTKRYSHPDWYQAADSETSIAHSGGVGLAPKQISDSRWVEKAILPITDTCIRINFEQARHEVVMEALGTIEAYVKALSRHHEVRTALGTINDLTTKCLDLFFRPPSSDCQSEPLELLAIADMLASMPISILLAYVEAINTYDRASILRSVGHIKWQSERAIYKTGLPLHLLKQLEWVRPRIEFEIRSEGARISPDWYIGELILQAASENAKDSLTVLLGELQAIFDRWLAAAAGSKLVWMRAAILSREAEYLSKIDYHLWHLRQHWANLNANKKIEGLPWPKLDFEKLEKGQTERQKQIHQLMAKHATTLMEVSRSDEYPDFAGQFIHAIGEALLKAMCENDSGVVNSLFPDLFICSLLQFDRLRANVDVSDWRAETSLKMAVAPVLDLMDLSGYAILLAELHDNPPISDPVITVWSAYFDSQKAASKIPIVQLLASAIALTESAFELAHRSLIRTEWGQAVADCLRQVERKGVFRRGGFYGTHQTVVHKSPLVRVFATEELGSFFDGIDVFIERILRQLDDGKDIEFGHRRGSLRDSLSREERRGREESEDLDA